MEGGMIIGQDKQDHEEEEEDDDVPQLIVKGKRTKRHRPQSPIPDAILLHHQHNHDYNSNDYYYYYSSSSSPANSTTEEEEDTAKCLILLSQGPSPPSPAGDEELGCKFSSKRYVETTAGNGRAGMYVYECKTCNRTFPSFQALGGHRASHKRPKHLQHQQMTRPVEDDEHQQEQLKHVMNNNNNGSTAVCVELGSNNNKVKGGCSNKVHECGICGAEFTSGQALGGHMRRHRNPAQVVNAAANTALSLTPTHVIMPISSAVDFDYNFPNNEEKKTQSKGGFYLDLNLPASPDVEEAQTSNHQQQQSPLVLSAAPTLVDCHY